jgi:oligosaccharide repeat unit polymerase
MPSSNPIALAGTFLIDASPVLWPVVAILAGTLLFFRSIRKRSRQLDVFELGVFYAVLVILYAVFPIISYLIGDLSFSPLSDIRLFQAQPSPKELAPICWYYFLYFGAFALCYAWFRDTRNRNELRVVMPPRYTLLALIVFLLMIKGFFLFIKFTYGLAAESYEESYLMYRGLPRLLQQILNHFGGITFTLEILIMALLVLNFRKYRYWIFGWILAELLSIFFGGIGSRTGLFVLLMSLAACYHFAVKKFSLRTALVVGLVVLLLFVSLGVVRNLTEINPDTRLNPFGYANEFESILGNAYDVSQLKAAGETQSVFPQFYFADFLNLIPQQLLPIKKIDVAAWYVNTFYPVFAESGGGLAFGAIPESILGLGWVDAVWRGAVIGILFAWLHRRFVKGRQTLWSYGFYVWVLILAYQCFRGGTFLLVPRVFYQFFLVFICIPIFAQVLAFFGSRKVSSIAHLTQGTLNSAASSRSST